MDDQIKLDKERPCLLAGFIMIMIYHFPLATLEQHDDVATACSASAFSMRRRWQYKAQLRSTHPSIMLPLKDVDGA